MSGCDARHSRPCATRTRCSYSPRCGWRDRPWRVPAVTSRARNVRSRGFRIRDGLPAIVATIEQSVAAARANAGSRELVEQPTPAELAVLRGLAAGLSRREIGAQLYISLNTVNGHTRELYRKLGAPSQTEAVARAEALGLLDPGQSPG